MEIFGIPLSKLRFEPMIKELLSFNKQRVIFTPNPEILLESQKDPNFYNILMKGDYRTIDGIGIYIALQMKSFSSPLIKFLLIPYFFFNLYFRRKMIYSKFGERICGSDLTEQLLKDAENKNIGISIVDLYAPDDTKKVASQKVFKNKLKEKFPKLDFDYYIYDSARKEKIMNQIQRRNTKILFSTLGMKKQETSVIEIMEKCSNIKLGLGVGSSFDYFIGFQKRAPKIMRTLGIEWLYRIFTSPNKWQRIKRIYNAIFVFLYKATGDK